MSVISHSDPPRARRFPEGFLWGTGTSSYQIEGAVATDGRGPSIWDVYAHTRGNVFRGDTGDIACDSYNRLDEDVRIVKELGVGAYRFSVSWPRVQPLGSGAVNQAGLDYYRRLAEQLRESGVQPVVTVYHWDLPQALEDQGGWANRDTAQRMAELALILGVALGDQVSMWITVNEPLQTVHQGYRTGTHAPGRCDDALAAAANHHIMLGHGLVLQALRQTTEAGTLIGPTMDPHPFIWLDPESEAVAETLDAEFNLAYLDPVLHGRYPEAARAEMLPPPALIHDGDMELIGAPIDFLGVNYYRPHHIRRGDWSDLRIGEEPIPGFPGFVEYQAPEQERTVMDWPIVPASLRDLLGRLHEDSNGLPLYITENGCAADDYVSPDGTIDDYERIAYIHGHLDAAADAITDGVNLAGYFHWSLMDNFEWAHGYRRRFGLHYVDFETGRRIPKRSAAFYGSVARTGRLPAREELFQLDGAMASTPTTPAAV
jgi:beta-glucosidase